MFQGISRSRFMRMAAAVLIIAVLIITMSAPQAQAASGKTKTSTVYDQVIVKGKYAYCAAYRGIYKVNLKKGTSKILKKTGGLPEVYNAPRSMILYHGYIYFDSSTSSRSKEPLCRIKTSGKGYKYLANAETYAISKGKIYYVPFVSGKNKQMKLNGKGKRKIDCKIKQRHKITNKKGYYVDSSLKNTYYTNEKIDSQYDSVIAHEYYYEYLVCPSGKRIFLCSYNLSHYE